MRKWSNHELTNQNHSADFCCPHCEAGSFEVVSVERYVGAHEETECALILRCLVCLGHFWHLAESESFAKEDICPMPAVTVGQTQGVAT